MATTDTRTGFRLPWSSEEKTAARRADETPSDDAPTTESATAAAPDATAEAPTDWPATAEAVESTVVGGTDLSFATPSIADPEQSVEDTSVQSIAPPAPPARPTGTAVKKPTKFLADLTRAMQAAAETNRSATLEQLQADAKAFIEQVHARSADGSAELRRQADDDIVSIRDWSKAELARIREQTEAKISTRKADLEHEIEAHAARIEREIERVQGRVAVFEAEMERFFERLLQEDDPTEFATMAQNLPEPPPFDAAHDDDSGTFEAFVAAPAAEPETEPPAGPTEDVADAPTVGLAEPVAEAVAPQTDDEVAATGDAPYATQDDPAAIEAAMAAIEAAYKAAEVTETPEASPPATDEAGLEPQAEDAAPSAAPEIDPRLAAFGLTTDLGAAEAEAAAAAAAGDDQEIPTIDDDALATRLAGLVPVADPNAPARPVAPKAAARTQVVVTGLISVASIASFKRHLGRLAGVQSVGVSSGPDSEFVFNVAHGPEVVLADLVPTLPGFEARVTGTGQGVVNVAARDPESEA